MADQQQPDLQAQMLMEFSRLAHKHAHVSFAVIGVVVLVLALMGAGGYVALKQYDKMLARAEAQEQRYDQMAKSFQDTLAANEAARAADQQKIDDLEGRIAQRTAQAPPQPIQNALKPEASAETIANGLTLAYRASVSFGPVTVEPPSKIVLSPSQAQEVIQSKVDLDRTQLDLADTRAIVDLEKGTVASLTGDLNQCRDLNAEANKTIADYKKVAKRSKFRKFLDGSKTVGLMIFAGYLGHKLP